MMTATPASNLVPLTQSTDFAAKVTARTVTSAGRRRISPEAGRGIEMLGHAIEYLSDEFALECMSPAARSQARTHPTVQAIELLMARNREIFFSCPEVPGLAERLKSMLHLQRA